MKTIQEWNVHTRLLAIKIMELSDQIPYGLSNNEVIKQITRSSNSVAANFRATQRAKSTADFLNKYKIVEEETDETIHFLLILEVRIPEKARTIGELIVLYESFLSMVVKSIKTIRDKNRR